MVRAVPVPNRWSPISAPGARARKEERKREGEGDFDFEVFEKSLFFTIEAEPEARRSVSVIEGPSQSPSLKRTNATILISDVSECVFSRTLM